MDRDFNKRKSIDAWDNRDLLLKIENTFCIQFSNDDLNEITTIGDICDTVVRKINNEHADTCTTQHAFYLVRNAIAATAGTEKCTIMPHTHLAKVFLKQSRQQAIADMERELGFEINLLQPKQWVIILFSVTMLSSLIAFYFYWEIAAAGCLASVLGLVLAGKFGKEIHLRTVGDLANKISRETYLKAKRNPAIKRCHVEQKVREIFAQELRLEPVVLARRSRF
jgi:hypothetical protein